MPVLGMGALKVVPFVVQAVLMGIDEGVFHRRRGLGRWERWGHPVDTLAFALALGFLCRVPPSPSAERVYLGLSVLSCLLVTKDEWVHARRCSPVEHWLHSLLFMLHPVTLWVAFSDWASLHAPLASPAAFLDGVVHPLRLFTAGVLTFFAGQVWTWNRPGRAFSPRPADARGRLVGVPVVELDSSSRR